MSRRTRSELAYCAASLPLSVAGFVLAVALLAPGLVLSVTVAGTFAKLGLPPSDGDNRRVLAVLRYLRS